MRLWLAALIALAVSPAAGQDAVGIRIAQSAAAAERLQGPLDGTWKLVDSRGQTLFVLQIGDSPTPGEALSCAWRAPDGTLSLADCTRKGARLTLAFDDRGDKRAVLRLTHFGVWRGQLQVGSAVRIVSLRRG
jgi:hypothetical protein